MACAVLLGALVVLQHHHVLKLKMPEREVNRGGTSAYASLVAALDIGLELLDEVNDAGMI